MTGLLLGTRTLGDRFGHKLVFQIGISAFGIASLLAAFSPNAWVLIVARALLAVGAALMLPATLAIIRFTFEDEDERNVAIAVWSSVSIGGIAFGPLVGGLLLEWFWWGSVLLINVPFALVTFLLAAIYAPTARASARTSWDPGGARPEGPQRRIRPARRIQQGRTQAPDRPARQARSRTPQTRPSPLRRRDPPRPPQKRTRPHPRQPRPDHHPARQPHRHLRRRPNRLGPAHRTPRRPRRPLQQVRPSRTTHPQPRPVHPHHHRRRRERHLHTRRDHRQRPCPHQHRRSGARHRRNKTAPPSGGAVSIFSSYVDLTGFDSPRHLHASQTTRGASSDGAPPISSPTRQRRAEPPATGPHYGFSPAPSPRVAHDARSLQRSGPTLPNSLRKTAPHGGRFLLVDLTGFEPVTFSLRTRRATNCAIGP